VILFRFSSPLIVQVASATLYFCYLEPKYQFLSPQASTPMSDFDLPRSGGLEEEDV
jgi:hypothetical protein